MTTVIIMNLILLVITILIVVADKLLADYGECKIVIMQDDGKKEISVQGGRMLLDYLVENKINISSSCGGKSSCGYCKVKVLKGAGEILPQEEIFMTRDEKHEGMRLACQVKVKNDIEIYIPDFLNTVKNMVQNRTYDPEKKWRFKVNNQTYGRLERRKAILSPEDEAVINRIIEEFKDVPGPLMPVLQKANESFNYLSEAILKYISRRLDMPFGIVLRTASFYNAFNLKPRGKYQINVCLGTACHVKRSADVILACERELQIKTGETTNDMQFSLDAVRCLGCCGLAPVLKINQDVYGSMTRKKVKELITKYREK